MQTSSCAAPVLGPHIDSLKPALVGVFTSQELESTVKWDFFFPEGAEGAAPGPPGQRAGAHGGAAAAQATAGREQGEQGLAQEVTGPAGRGRRGRGRSEGTGPEGR